MVSLWPLQAEYIEPVFLSPLLAVACCPSLKLQITLVPRAAKFEDARAAFGELKWTRTLPAIIELRKRVAPRLHSSKIRQQDRASKIRQDD
jgi:hypothetical protein